MHRDIKICYIGGGSKLWARIFMADLAVSEGLSGEIALYDIDKEAAERNAKIGGYINENPNTVSKFTYTVYDKLEDALQRADFGSKGTGTAQEEAVFDQIEELLCQLLAEQACFGIKDLAVDGNDLIAMGFAPGPRLGSCLAQLLTLVQDEKLPNEKEALLEAAKHL